MADGFAHTDDAFFMPAPLLGAGIDSVPEGCAIIAKFESFGPLVLLPGREQEPAWYACRASVRFALTLKGIAPRLFERIAG